nr:MAG TPA: hypothetical protein [Caudoviricetes sp.]
MPLGKTSKYMDCISRPSPDGLKVRFSAYRREQTA